MSRWIAVLMLVIALSVHAQSDLPSLSAQLTGKVLFLRCFCAKDSLSFGPDGKLLGQSATVSPTLSGVRIAQVLLQPDALELDGIRIGLAFVDGKPNPVALHVRTGKERNVRIVISRPPSGDYGPLLAAMVAATFPDLAPNLAPEWHRYGMEHFPEENQAQLRPVAPGPEIRKGTVAVTAPRLTRDKPPNLSEEGRLLRYSGAVLVRLVIDSHGLPTQVEIERPAGLGYDELAVEAVRQYRFAPAVENGVPVAVGMQVEMHMSVF